jgi:acetyltransferase-like isoleucine patch superfamily enzyme
MRLINIFKNIYIKYLILKANEYSVAQIFRKYYNIKIGKNVRFTSKKISWGSESYLIEIGNNVTITGGVIFETHDGGVSVFREKYPGINVYGKIKIGNNVFLGNNCIILPNVSIGDNVVVGAGSIVTKNTPSNVVVAGVPAKIIKSINDYEEKIKRTSIIMDEKNPKLRKQIIENHLKSLSKS